MKIFMKIFASKKNQQFSWKVSSTFFFKLFSSKFSLRFFFRICFRIAGQEFSPGSNGGTPRLQIDLGKKIQTIFDSWLSGPGKLQHCPEKGELTVGNPSPTSTNTLFFPPNHSPPIVIDSRPDFAYDTSPIAGRSHQSFSSSGACGTCVSYDMHLRKLFTPLPHKYFVPHVFSPTLPPPRWHIDNPSRTHVLPPNKPNQLLLRVWYPCAVWRASASFSIIFEVL